MKIDRLARKFALAVMTAVMLAGGSNAFGARSTLSSDGTALAAAADITAIERASKDRLLAIGRLDGVSRSNYAVRVLGQKFVVLAGPGNSRFIAEARVGQAVALFGELRDGRYLVDAAMSVDGQYVQGASKVYLRGPISLIDRSVGAMSIGGAHLDTSSLVSRSAVDRFSKGAVAAVI